MELEPKDKKIREMDTEEWKQRVQREAIGGVMRGGTMASLPISMEGEFQMSEEEKAFARGEAVRKTFGD